MAIQEKNLCAKSRPVNQPYEVWNAGGWTWQVLKKYQSQSKEASNEYARWLCAVKSPNTYPSYDLGDVYVSDVKKYAVLVWQEGNDNLNNGQDTLPVQYRF